MLVLEQVFIFYENGAQLDVSSNESPQALFPLTVFDYIFWRDAFVKDAVIAPPSKDVGMYLCAVWTIARNGDVYCFSFCTCSLCYSRRDGFAFYQRSAGRLTLMEVF